MGYILSKNKPIATTWDNLNNKPAILSDNQIAWSEVQNKPNIFPPAIQLESGKINVSLGNNQNTLLSPSAIEIPSDNTYGGFYDLHSGVRLTCGDHWGWTSQKFKVYIASNWDEYNSPPCLIASNSTLEIPGIFRGENVQAVAIPNNPSGLSTGTFYRDSNGFVKVVI